MCTPRTDILNLDDMDKNTWLAKRRAIEEVILRRGFYEGGWKHFLLSRDWFWRPAIRLALFCCGLLGRGYRNATHLTLRRLCLSFSNLPPAFDGFRILHISDPHIDKTPQLANVVADMVKRLPVDLCVVTGDFRFEMAGACEGVYGPMEVLLREVQSVEGAYGILGNHDSYELDHGLEQIGLRMLTNRGVRISRGSQAIFLAGVDDPNTYRLHDLQAALRDSTAGEFRVLLAHSPELYDQADRAGVSLYLCGHTHGGQICLPSGRPLRLDATSPPEYGRGVWRHGAMTGVTSSGMGCAVVPVRYNCPPEIAVIELRNGRGML